MQASDQAGVALLMANSTLALSRTSLTNNTASTAGGAVVVLGGSQLSCVSRCNFTRNSAALGGAIAVQSATVNLADAVLSQNTAPSELVSVMFGSAQQRAGSGGAVFAANATLKLAACSLLDNKAELQGGALQLMSSNAHVVESTLARNRAERPGASTSTAAAAGAVTVQRGTAGGAILASLLPSSGAKPGQLKLQDCVLSSNTAGFGGALAAIDSGLDLQAAAAASSSAAGMTAAPPLSVQVVDTALTNNTARVSGGAVFTSLPSTVLTLNNSKVTANTAADGGGGIAAITPAGVQLVGSSISSNVAEFCAGMLLDSPTKDSGVRSSTVEGNAAGQQSVDDRTLGELPQWNSTGSGGGLCIIPAGVVSITKTAIKGNTAMHGGGCVGLVSAVDARA